MDFGIKDRKALVLGGSSGIGFATAKLLASEGAKIIIASRIKEKLETAVNKIEELTKYRPEYAIVDLSDEKSISSLTKSTLASFGDPELLVINSGGPLPLKSLHINNENWDFAFNNNFLSVARICNAFVPKMIENKFGRIVAITSVSAKQPLNNMVLSNSMRIAVSGYIKSLSNEIAKYNVTINSVLPGPTKTERLKDLIEKRAENEKRSYESIEMEWLQSMPVGRLGEPEEVASLIVYLLSQNSGFITGQSFLADGGHYPGVF